jgi:serine/threonine-protein kinase
MATCPTCRTRYPDDSKVCSADGTTLLPDEAVPGDGDLAPGLTVGEYRVEGKLGEGGFGAVYRAVHPLIGKMAAIKVLHKQFSSNPQMVSRFIAEARAVNQIHNRNIIDIFSFGALEDGRQYYVMELLDGSTLDAYLKQRGRLSPEEAMPILRGIARALDAAHATGIAHRDLKPENVFLVFEDDGVVFPKLLDFGIAKLLGESISAHKTRTGTPMGTPHYMSPEQCRGRNVDHRTDLYSFGVLLFEALTGKVPFDGEDVMEILMKHTTAPAPLPSQVCPALPAALDAPMVAFLDKDPEKRPASLGVGLDALAQAAADAGFDVKVSVRKPGDAARTSGPQVRVGNATPAELGALVEARTMVQPEAAKTILAAESLPKPAAGRTMMYGVMAAVGLAAAMGGVAVLRPRGPPAVAQAVVTPPVPAATAEAVPSVTPSVTPSAMVTPPALPAEVDLTVESSPKVVDVYLAGVKIGTNAAPLKLKRVDGKVKLTFRADGYAPRELDVPASVTATIKVELPRIGGGPVGKKKSDLEY